MIEGLLQLAHSLEKHLTELHSEIVVVRKTVANKGARTPRTGGRKRK
jgi:hypothetical protein